MRYAYVLQFRSILLVLNYRILPMFKLILLTITYGFCSFSTGTSYFPHKSFKNIFSRHTRYSLASSLLTWNLIATIGTFSPLMLNPGVVMADYQVSEKLISSVENIARVKASLKYVNDDIEKGIDASQVVRQVKLLLNNYKLKENVYASLELVPSNKKDDARGHGRAAIEDLTAVFEYFSDELDDLTGERKVPREYFDFTMRSLNAADRELGDLLLSFPRDIVDTISLKISQEYNGSS